MIKIEINEKTLIETLKEMRCYHPIWFSEDFLCIEQLDDDVDGSRYRISINAEKYSGGEYATTTERLFRAIRYAMDESYEVDKYFKERSEVNIDHNAKQKYKIHPKIKDMISKYSLQDLSILNHENIQLVDTICVEME